jgi:molecular chaperone GrpE
VNTETEPRSEASGGAAAAQDDPRSVENGLRKELLAAKDQLLRAVADQENSRRRAEREHKEIVRFAAARLARDLLETADNLHRAIESVPAERAEDGAIHDLLAGLVVTERALTTALEKHGIRRLHPIGEQFDPRMHQAIAAHHDLAHRPGTIVEVAQPGYVMHDRLLRPALVGVSMGGDPPQEISENDSSNTAEKNSGAPERDANS